MFNDINMKKIKELELKYLEFPPAKPFLGSIHIYSKELLISKGWNQTDYNDFFSNLEKRKEEVLSCVSNSDKWSVVVETDIVSENNKPSALLVVSITRDTTKQESAEIIDRKSKEYADKINEEQKQEYELYLKLKEKYSK